MSCDETFNAGICYVTDAYRMVCRFNDELRADLEECRVENVKLRAMRDTWAENDARLRELVRDMWHELDAATQYDAGGGRGVVYEFADRMRDLGIEASADA